MTEYKVQPRKETIFYIDPLGNLYLVTLTNEKEKK